MPWVPPDLKDPAYQHLLVNHLPIVGLLAGAIALFVGLCTRRRVAQVPALVVIFLMAGSAYFVFQTGEAAHSAVRPAVDDMGNYWLDAHLDRARLGIYGYYVLAALALISLLAPLRWPRSATPLGWSLLALTLVTVAVGAWIAQPGVYIRHAEVRPPPPIFDEVALPQP